MRYHGDMDGYSDYSQLMADCSEALPGTRESVRLAVEVFAAGGHLLLEDVPGVGKTTLARAMALAIGGASRRIQFTPDLLPSDLTGVSIWDQRHDTFVFHPGPLFANIVIADEINRANPKTQSAMLEAMGENAVSADGATHALPKPFFVVATQNPIELEGTYPLPEAQLDRFMACTSFGYPSRDAERAMLLGAAGGSPLDAITPVCSLERAVALREAVSQVTLGEAVADYIVALIDATRAGTSVAGAPSARPIADSSLPAIRYGASPRASLHLASMAKAHALAQGRSFVLPDDVQAVAEPVLAHRLVLEDMGYGTAVMAQSRRIIAALLAEIPVPRA